MYRFSYCYLQVVMSILNLQPALLFPFPKIPFVLLNVRTFASRVYLYLPYLAYLQSFFLLSSFLFSSHFANLWKIEKTFVVLSHWSSDDLKKSLPTLVALILPYKHTYHAHNHLSLLPITCYITMSSSCSTSIPQVSVYLFYSVEGRKQHVHWPIPLTQ